MCESDDRVHQVVGGGMVRKDVSRKQGDLAWERDPGQESEPSYER